MTTIQIGNFTYDKNDVADAYDPNLVPVLENYLQTAEYDKTAILRLLKLYQFYPNLVKLNVVYDCLLRALMNGLPDTDITLCLYLLSEKTLQDETIVKLTQMTNSLECGQFTKFWNIKSQLNLPFPKDFDKTIQKFIVRVLSLTYSVISFQVLKEQVHTDNLEQFMKEYPDIFDLASVTGDSVNFLPNQYNKIVAKKHQKEVSFAQVYGLIADMK